MYRKKPVVVEAIKWDGLNVSEIKDFCGKAVRIAIYDSAWKARVLGAKADIFIVTLEGTQHASVGDYIIKGVNGEFYPCKPDIFEKTYEECVPDNPYEIPTAIVTPNVLDKEASDEQ